MADVVTGRAELRELFSRFSRYAFRLETHPKYHEVGGDEPLRRFLAGQQQDDSWMTSWLASVREQVACGRRLERVRVVSEPMTDYQRFAMDLALRCNIPAGEDIRVLPAGHARELELPDHDFWLFDDERVAFMRFDAGVFIDAEVSSAPDVVEEYRNCASTAWHHAVSYREFLRQAR